MRIQSHETVDDVMRRHPATIRIFIRHHLHCIGCAFGGFCTIEEACASHGATLSVVLADLRRVYKQKVTDTRASS